MMFLAVLLVLVVGIHYIAKQDGYRNQQQNNKAQQKPLPNLSQDGEFNVEIEREFQKIVEGIKKEQK